MKKALTLALALTLSFALALARPGRLAADETPRSIDIKAQRFEFTPATITLKKGETVRLRVTSDDVTHGLFLRALKIDMDIVPGEVREVTVTPETLGTFTAICHHFCGAGHGGMKLTVVVE
ncbi:MAG TPA: cupredoxin domain-containing protein [Thermoanaerobaculia bacterium]